MNCQNISGVNDSRSERSKLYGSSYLVPEKNTDSLEVNIVPPSPSAGKKNVSKETRYNQDTYSLISSAHSNYSSSSDTDKPSTTSNASDHSGKYILLRLLYIDTCISE